MHVKIYLDSEVAFITDYQRIEASYPLEYFNRFKTGQVGNFYLDKHRWPEFTPIEVTLENISVDHAARKVRLFLVIAKRESNVDLMQGMKGKVVLLTAERPPFELFLSQLGRKIISQDGGDNEL